MAELDRSNPFAFAGESARDVFNPRTLEETKQVQNFLNAIPQYRSIADAVRTDTVPQQITREFTTRPRAASEVNPANFLGFDINNRLFNYAGTDFPKFQLLKEVRKIENAVERGDITRQEGNRLISNYEQYLGLSPESSGITDRAKERIGKELESAYGNTSATFDSNPIRSAYDDTSGSMLGMVEVPMPPPRPSSIAKESIDLGASLAEDSNVKDTTQSLLGSINWGALLDIFAQPAFLADNQSPVEAFVAASQQKQQREQVAEQRQALLEQEQAKAALAQANKERELEIKEAAETRLRQQAGLPPELKPATGTEIKTMYEMIQRDDQVIKNLKNNYKDTSNEFGKGHRIIELMASINKTYPGRKLEEIRAAAYNMLEAGKGVGSSSVNNDEFVEADLE
tara:strand:+ start:74 stop:1270 length:1197 start_codon:yes stop_codon:yes gene_type:complete